MSLFEQVGGEQLRSILEDFYDRVIGDAMIGFFFVGKSKQRLVDKEWEFAARILGHDVPYTGKGIRAAHAAHPIMGGHFERRLQILRDTLADHDVPTAVADAWVEHTEKLRHLVTADRGSDCRHETTPSTASATRRLPIIDD